METILFLHFHKAGGTTINRLFNNKKKYPLNKNGNPYLDKETIIHFWNFNLEQFEQFKRMLKKLEVRFIAMEWNFFKNDVSFNGVRLITCLRDPYDRFISNLNYDKKLDAREYQKENIKCSDYVNKKPFYINYNKNNYYVKLLNGLGDRPDVEVDESDLENAKKLLEKFRDIIILEKPWTFNQLKKYGIKNYYKKNETLTPKIDGGMTREEFVKNNILDYELYNYACYLVENKKKLKKK